MKEEREDIVLPVPETLSAAYLVPSPLSGPEATEIVLRELPSAVPGAAGQAVEKMLRLGAVDVGTCPASALPPVLAELQEHLGVDAALVDAVTSADRFVVFIQDWKPGWPPVHEVTARACAAALAGATGVPLVDSFVPLVLAAGPAAASLPVPGQQIRLSDWVVVPRSVGPLGLRVTTKGLGRFGLPELEARNVPPQLAGPWTRVMTGIAGRLLDLWLDALRARDGAASAAVRSEFEVSAADVAEAYGEDDSGGDGRRALVRLVLDPAPGDGREDFLTVQPPRGYPGWGGEHMAEVCEALFGPDGREVRYLPADTPGMAEAIAGARATLGEARNRFRAGLLPPGTQLIVKYEVPGEGIAEYPWAHVTSWDAPGKVFASMSSGLADGSAAAGRPLVIDAATIIDWAVWAEGKGIVEGGRTQAIAAARPAPPPGP